MGSKEKVKVRSKEWISDLEDRMVEFTAVEQNKEKKNEKK